MKVLSLLLASLFFGMLGLQEAVPQARHEPVLVDEFSRLPCDDFIYRIDSFFQELSSDPNSKGIVMNRGETKTQLLREEMIRSHTDYRNFDKGRLSYIRTPASPSMKTQLWRVPPGSASPISASEVDPGYVISEPRPLLFLRHYPDGEGEVACPEINSRRLFGLVLAANPQSRGNIVIRGRSWREARDEQGRTLRYLVRTSKIERKRIRFFLRRPSGKLNNYQPDVEYWYLP